jgi:predicted dehydrogenase
MKKTIRLGIIGVGQIGKIHLETYQNFEDVEVLAIADINEEEVHRVAIAYDIPNAYTDFNDLLKRDDLEAIDVCLHNNLHMPVTVAAFEAGKHVYCEKPMAGSYHDARIMLEKARKFNRKLSIQIHSLYKKDTKAAKVLIDEGMLGTLYHACATGFRRRGRPYVDGYGSSSFVQKKHARGGALYDMGVYHIARMLYLLGNPEPTRISGKIYQETDMDSVRRERSNYDVEELALGFVKFQGGMTLSIAEAWAIHLDGFASSYIVGNKGGIRLEPFGFEGSSQKKSFGFYHSFGDMNLNTSIDLDAFDSRVHYLREHADAYDGSQAHWIAVLQERVELLPTAEVALNTMLISEGIYLSDKLGREVTAEEIKETSYPLSLNV